MVGLVDQYDIALLDREVSSVVVLDVRLEATELPVVSILFAITLQKGSPWN